MPTYKIRGIDVDFPFEAYECQLVYMEKVIQSLQNRCNALLESPTGTGKTLCLLCATLAWRKSLGGFSTGKKWESGGSSQSEAGSGLPTIVYASRTHSQLRHVIQELKRTSYRPKMVILGSREQLCIHEDVSLLRGKAQTNACHFICKKRGNRQCGHFFRTADFMKNNPHLGDEPVDIEDLVNIGRRSGPCPYYISRELHKVVDILFAPYNYLIDRSYRKSLAVNWNSSVLIFDEAHNLESICADAASFDLSSGLMTACISEAKSCIDLSVSRREESNDKSRNPDDFAILRALLLKLEKQIAEVPIQSRELGFTKPGPFIYELLGDLNITHDTASKLIKIIEDAAILLEEDKQSKTTGTACRLESMSDILQIIFSEKSSVYAHFYRVHMQEAANNAMDAVKGKASRTLSWWCFNPGIAMEEFTKMGVGSIILTSGTLSPLESFAQELKLDFPIRLQNPHVISSSQIWVGVVPTGPSGRTFNSSYRNRDSLEYKQELGNAIVNFSRIVPDGLLVFFPSYYLLEQCIGSWKNMSPTNAMTIWERICKHKKPVVEPRQSSLFPSAIEDYMAKLKDHSISGAVFFAVCRGKVSEGLDFADHAGRAVVIIGMPFASRNEPKVRLKREYLDEQVQLQREGHKCISGEDWYSQQAMRAVNQAVGRVIRHRHDYGAIIFCDERFGHSSRQSQISVWIQPHINGYSNFGDVVFSLSRFFRDGGTCDSAKLNVGQNEAITKVGEASRPVDKFCLDSHHSQPAPTDVGFTLRSLSSLPEVNRHNNASHFTKILPANRSSFTPLKENQDFKLNYCHGLSGQHKELLVSEKKSMQRQCNEMMPFMCKSSPYEMLSSEGLLFPIKKRKTSSAEIATKGHTTNSHVENGTKSSQSNDLSSLLSTDKQKHLHISGSMGREHCIVSLPSLDDHEIRQERDTQFLSQKSKGLQSTAVPHANEETRGTAFLIQVKEKLSNAEYREFVEFMKALKSKAMAISHVLRSIVRLFSGAERLPLLKRFKDFVPAKYHAIYDHYVEANGQKLDNQKSEELDGLT